MVSRRSLLPLSILLLGFGLRLIALNGRILAYDDTFSIFLAERSWGEIVRGTAADTMPPLYYFLLHLWMPVTGQTPFAMRFLGVFGGMLALPLTCVLAHRLVGRGATPIATLLVAINPFLIYHSQELRMYTCLALGLALYTYGAARWLRLRARRVPLQDEAETVIQPGHGVGWAFVIVAGATIALYSHNLAVLTLAAPPLWLAWRRRWRDLVGLIGWILLAGLFYLPWLVLVPGQITKIQRAFWIPRPGLVEIIQIPVIWLTNLPLPAWLLPIALFVALALLALSVLETVRAHRRQATEGRTYLVALIVIPLVLMFVLSYLMRPIFVARGVIFANIAYAVLLGGLLALEHRTVVRAAALVPILLVTAPALAYHYTYDEFPRSPFDRLVLELRERVPRSELIVYDNKVSFFPAHFYDRTLSQSYLADEPGSPNDTLAPASMEALQLFPIAPGVVENAPAVWFVIFDRDIRVASEEGFVPVNLVWLDSRRERTVEFTVGDLRVIRYE